MALEETVAVNGAQPFESKLVEIDVPAGVIIDDKSSPKYEYSHQH